MSVDVWSAVADRRRVIAGWTAGVSAGDAGRASWCDGWQVRDVLGHLVHLAEATQLSMARDLVRNGVAPDRALSRKAREIGAAPMSELATRLERAAGGRFHIVGTPAAVALGELLVHEADMASPLGHAQEVDPALAVAVLPIYRRVGRVAFHAPPPSKVRLVATDAAWAAGDGPEVRGTALDLVLTLANRRQVRSRLEGPGVSALP